MEIAIWLVCVPNTVNCLCTFIGIWLVERAGRRVLTMGSIIGKFNCKIFKHTLIGKYTEIKL